MAAFLLFLIAGFVEDARAGWSVPSHARPEHFYDWDYAVWVWTELNTSQKLEEEWARVWTPAFEKHKRAFKQNPNAAYILLKDHPEAEKMFKAWAIKMVVARWRVIVGMYRRTMLSQGFSWNRNHKCGWFPAQNIFTGKCNDAPDWRSEERRERDEAKAAKIRASRKERGDWPWDENGNVIAAE